MQVLFCAPTRLCYPKKTIVTFKIDFYNKLFKNIYLDLFLQAYYMFRSILISSLNIILLISLLNIFIPDVQILPFFSNRAATTTVLCRTLTAGVVQPVLFSICRQYAYYLISVFVCIVPGCGLSACLHFLINEYIYRFKIN